MMEDAVNISRGEWENAPLRRTVELDSYTLSPYSGICFRVSKALVSGQRQLPTDKLFLRPINLVAELVAHTKSTINKKLQ